MARASAIWYVTWPGEVEMRAAFTVKRELESWLERHPENAGEEWGVWKIGDGHHNPEATPIRLDRRNLEPIFAE